MTLDDNIGFREALGLAYYGVELVLIKEDGSNKDRLIGSGKMSEDRTQLDLREQIARIDRDRAETAKYAAEQRKLEAEARNFDRLRWQMLVTAMTAGAVLFGAGAAFVKLMS